MGNHFPFLLGRMATLRQFLEEHRIVGNADKRQATLTGISGGKYDIPDEDYPMFLDLLHKYLFEENGRPLNLIEQPTQFGPKPLLVDLDFRYPKDRALDHPFDTSHIEIFVHKLTEGLNLFFNLSIYDKLRFFVCLRPQGYESKSCESKEKEIKDGIHIECPDIILSYEKQAVLRNWMLNENVVNLAFKDTGFINSTNDIYDKTATGKQGWFLYGESKPSIPKYSLTKVLVYTPETETWSSEPISDYDSRELLELLSIRYNLDNDDNIVKDEVKALYSRFVKVTPLQLPPIVNLNDTLEIIPRNILVQEAMTAPVADASYEDIELVQRFVRECLSVERAENYETWIRVGLCLHGISQSTDMFNLWMDFSAKSPKSVNNDIVKLKRNWDYGMHKEGNGNRLTIRSLRHWALQDNPTAFRNIIEKDIVNYVLNCVSPTHNHVARLMKRMFQDGYAASIGSRSTDWYEFNEVLHMWKKIDQGVALRNKISMEVADMIAEARFRFKRDPQYKKMEAYTNNNKSIEVLKLTLTQLVEKRVGLKEVNKIDEAKVIDKEIEDTEKSINLISQKQEKAAGDVKDNKFSELTELENKLYDASYKDKVMKECIGLFYEEEFEKKLNSNPFCIGCANGVLHLDAIKPDPANPGKMKPMNKDEGDPYNFFQKGTPEDYVTFHAGRSLPEYDTIPYIEYDPSDPIHYEIDDFFAKLFPRPDLRNWVLKLLASCLEGKNREQCYYTFQGVGGNGKSKLVDLMIMTLGDYQSSLQSTALTRKRPESGAANPDIMSIKNKRFIYMQEPDDREPLNTSRMKQFSGEDAVEARGLYADQERFKISGKLFMMCNNLPAINSMDRGTWRRVRLIPFESKFVNPGDKEIGQPNVFLKDMNLNAKLKRWRIPFFSRLVHIYLTQYAINDNGTLEPAPEIVSSESDKYREAFDSFARFRNSRIRVDRDSDEQTTIADIWRSYRYWQEAVGGAGKKLSQAELIARLQNEFGPARQNRFYTGLLVFNTEEDLVQYDQEQLLKIVNSDE